MRIKSSPPSSWALANASDLDMTPRISSLPSLVPMVTRREVWTISLFMGGMYSAFFMGWRRPPPRLMAERDVGESRCGGDNIDDDGEVMNASVRWREDVARMASTVVSAELVIDDTIFFVSSDCVLMIVSLSRNEVVEYAIEMMIYPPPRLK